MKSCSSCKAEKQNSSFNKSKQKPDGYDSYCRDCRKIKSVYRPVKAKKSDLEKLLDTIYKKTRKHLQETGKSATGIILGPKEALIVNSFNKEIYGIYGCVDLNGLVIQGLKVYVSDRRGVSLVIGKEYMRFIK